MKQKRYWFRGGVIALILALIYWSYGAINLNSTLGFFPFSKVMAEWTIIFIVSITVIGIISGWIYGKVKNRTMVR
jgi:hypothetical protein